MFALGFGCGAQGTEAPYVIHPTEQTGECISTEEALEKTRAELRSEALSSIGPHVEEILVDDGGMRVVIPGLLLASRAIGVDQALSLSRGYAEGEGLARVKKHMLQVIDYLTGDSPYIDGEHFAVVDAVHRVVTGQGQGCDHLGALGAFRRLLQLKVPGENGELVPWVDPAFDALVTLVEDDTFQSELSRFAFSDEGRAGADVVVGREAFQLVMRLGTANVAQDNFDLSIVRGLFEDLLVFQLPDDSAARGKMLAVIDQFEIILDPELDAFPFLQDTLRCVNDVDGEGEIYGLFFDYLSIEELNLGEFFRDLDAFGADPAGITLRLFLEDGVEAMESEPVLSRDMLAVLNRFIEPERSRDVLEAMQQLEGTGVFTELILFAESMVRSCIGADP